MAQKQYIIRNRDNKAWLFDTQPIGKGPGKVYRYMPDLGIAMVFESLKDARKTAEECRGRVQVLKHNKTGEAYAEDIER